MNHMLMVHKHSLPNSRAITTSQTAPPGGFTGHQYSWLKQLKNLVFGGGGKVEGLCPETTLGANNNISQDPVFIRVNLM